MNSNEKRRLINLAAAVLLAQAAASSVQRLMAARRDPLRFDDAYMFLRYAHNIRHGLGFSWNLDGVHTYGPTSLLWSFCALLLSYLPTDPWTQLIFGSWLCSIAAVVAIAWAVAKNAQNVWLRSQLRVLPLVALPLLGGEIFQANQFNGMETMLATFLCAVFVGLALQWRAGRVSFLFLAFAGLLLFLARPESAIVALALPALLWALLGPERPPLKPLLTFYAVFLGGVLADFTLCQLYFGTPVPLSVYMKGHQAYLGYRGVWHPWVLLLDFLSATQLFFAALVLLVRNRDRRLVLACLLPAAIVFFYLGTVTQIMGFNSRYYVPYVPLIIVPALLVLDRWLAADPLQNAWPRNLFRTRTVLTAAMLLFFFIFSSQAVQLALRRLEHGSHFEYASAHLNIQATTPLPEANWDVTMRSITDDLIAPLPAGVSIAATEVGYLGDHAPQLNVIDLAGLNDTSIAMHGFSMDQFLQAKPDFIWMPNTDYTYQRGIMFADPAFLAQYDVYADAGDYGIAVRKNSSFRSQIDRQLQSYWQKVYPGFDISSYLVRSATWSGQKQATSDD